MPDGPAPRERRRVPRGLLGALVVFLLLPFPPLFLAGPLAGLLLLTRPGGFRSWAWTILALLLALGAFAVGGDSSAQLTVQAAGLVFTGAFLAAMLWRPGPAFPRAAAAGLLTAVTITAGAGILGITWDAFRFSVQLQFRDALAFVTAGSTMSPDQITSIQAFSDLLAGVFPALALLGALAGGSLAAALAAHVSGAGPRPAPFAAFRFNDQFIWGAVLTLGLVLLRPAGPWLPLVTNVLVVWMGLYVARGAAVVLALWTGWSLALRIALCMVAVLLLHFALSALLGLGLADTWLDFRRRFRPPDSQGVKA